MEMFYENKNQKLVLSGHENNKCFLKTFNFMNLIIGSAEIQ